MFLKDNTDLDDIDDDQPRFRTMFFADGLTVFLGRCEVCKVRTKLELE